MAVSTPHRSDWTPVWNAEDWHAANVQHIAPTAFTTSRGVESRNEPTDAPKSHCRDEQQRGRGEAYLERPQRARRHAGYRTLLHRGGRGPRADGEEQRAGGG